jgi:hypothetical protein
MRYFIAFILVSSIVHATCFQHLYACEYEKTYSIYKDSIPELTEILIAGKKKKIYVREDTSFYRVNGFADGTEKTIADILKKIPGFAIDPANGIITYQGRTVEKMKIDGADLFGNNYVIGSKNLSAGWIEEIQAIENDPDNPLLKNMTSHGKLVINLKTKKNMAVINSNINPGGGYRGDEHVAADTKVQSLRLASRIKSFAVAGFNNRGVNNGAINYLQYNDRNNPFQYSSCKVPSIFTNAIHAPLIDPDRLWINHNGLVNTNVIIQPGSRQKSFRLNACYSSDQLYTNDVQRNRYSSGALSLVTSDQTSLLRKPAQFQGELEWKQFLTNDIWLSYKSIFHAEKQTIRQQQNINDSIVFSGHTRSGNQLNLHEFDLTFRVSPQMIFRSSCTLSSYHGNEQIDMRSDRKSTSYTGGYIQDIEVNKKIFRYEAGLVLKKGTNAMEITTGIRRSYESFHSVYHSMDDTGFESDGLHHNQQQTHYTKAHQSVSFTHRKGKNIIQSGIHVWVHDLSVNYYQHNQWQATWLKPDIFFSITRKVSDEMKWVNHFNMRHQLISEMPYFDRAVRISPRIILINDVFPQIQRSLSCQSMLVYQDLFRQQRVQIDWLYVLNDRSSAPFLQINEKIIQSRSLILDIPQQVGQLNAHVEKFITPFYSNVSLEANLSVSTYFNYVNAKQVRENRSLNRKAILQIKTALPVLLNATYTCSIEEGIIYSDREKIRGDFLWRQGLNLLWKYGKAWHGQVRADWYQPQRPSVYSIVFMDALISFRPLKKNYGLSMSARNILNHRSFQQTRIIDYSTVTNSMSLLPLTFLLEWDYRF